MFSAPQYLHDLLSFAPQAMWLVSWIYLSITIKIEKLVECVCYIYVVHIILRYTVHQVLILF